MNERLHAEITVRQAVLEEREACARLVARLWGEARRSAAYFVSQGDEVAARRESRGAALLAQAALAVRRRVS